MAILRIGGLPVSGALRFGGLPLSGAERVMGLGPLPAAPTPVAEIPTPTRYWALDGSLYDAIGDWYIDPQQGSVEYVEEGATYGTAPRLTSVGTAWIGIADSAYGSPSRVLVAAWLRNGAVLVAGDTGSSSSRAAESTGVRTLCVAELTGFDNPLTRLLLRIGSEGGDVGQADELALWLDPPEYWTVEAAQASLYNGGLGVVWRSGRWWRVAA